MLHREHVSFVCLCALVLITGILAQEQCRSALLPTEYLREVIIAKCTLYQEVVNPPQFCNGTTLSPRNCTEVWEAFSSAFVGQPRCNVSDHRYEDYIKLTHQPIPQDKSLFWENVYEFVHRFSNKGAKYVTLSDTFTGYIGNGLMWCSDTGKGITEAPDECPDFEATPNCSQGALRAFWIAASRSYGVRASGGIQIMLNASATPIFAKTTYLAVYELPFLQKSVTKATVLMVNENPQRGSSKCADQSLNALAELIRAKGIQYECVENRRDVAQLLCLDNPHSKICSVLEPETNRALVITSSLVPLALVVFVGFSW